MVHDVHVKQQNGQERHECAVSSYPSH